MIVGKRRGGREIQTSLQRLGGVEPWREKDLRVHFISKSSITNILTFPSKYRGHVTMSIIICLLGEAGVAVG